MSRRRPGRLLVLEGLDGAGTTTQSRLLAEALRRQGRKVHLTAEPSGGPVGALVRQVLTRRIAAPAGAFDADAMALLFAADRLDHHASEIAPRLARGEDVVSDRYTLSSLAYQSLTTGDTRWVERINSRAPAPTATLFLRVRPAVAWQRRFAESGGGELYEVPEFQRRVARSYERALRVLAKQGQRLLVLDGARAVDEVARSVLEAVAGL